VNIPHIDRLHTKIWLAASLPGALNMRHVECGTAACRAGWVNRIVYGKAWTWDDSRDPLGNATMAYRAHGYDPRGEDWGVKIPWFFRYIPNADALEKLHALAMMECAGVGMAGEI
jgi:hypothetical protein